MGEDHRAAHVVVPVHRVHAIDNRDAQAALQGGVPVAGDHGLPGGRVVRLGIAAAAAENRADAQVCYRLVFDMVHGHQHRLRHFFFQGHTRH